MATFSPAAEASSPPSSIPARPTTRISLAQELGLALVVLLLGGILSVYGWHDAAPGRPNTFLNFDNLIDGIATPTSYYAIMAVGLTIVIITGGIDISVGSTMALSALGLAAALQRMPVDAPAIEVLAVAATVPLGIGLLCGLINGALIVGLSLHPFIVTLGTMSIFRGLANVLPAQKTLPAAGTEPRILIFDEPTSSLAEPDAQNLFRLIEELKTRGITMIYVSHRMPELFRLCDKISILRDGQYVGTQLKGNMTHDAVVQMMIGRPMEEYFPRHLTAKTGGIVLQVRNLASPGRFRNVNFEIRAGEIVGFAGLVGAGRSEVAKAIFGLDPRAAGEVLIDGKLLSPGKVKAAMLAGAGLVPEDRKRQGCVPGMPCRANISMALLDRLWKAVILDRKKEKQIALQYFEQLRIKAASIEAPVNSLSGGNQQKVVLAKWLARGGKLLIVDEPTRGVDIGAKAAIHALIDELARQGLAVMLISSELPEVINLSMRILVMREGEIAGELSRAHASQEAILRLMAGVSDKAA